MKDELYTQCKLRKGTTWQVAYIPHKFAEVGRWIKLRDIFEKWEDKFSWQVIEVYNTITKKEAIFNESLWKSQREASDV